jgi:hypothetical protein
MNIYLLGEKDAIRDPPNNILTKIQKKISLRGSANGITV